MPGLMQTIEGPLATSPKASLHELGASEFARLGARALKLVGDALYGVRQRPVAREMGAEARVQLSDLALPRAGISTDELLTFFEQHILPYPRGNGHPRFFGWVLSAPSHIGVLAELLGAAFNAPCGGEGHAAIYLEQAVGRWLMELLGFPVSGSYALLVSGGSMASASALAAARQWCADQDGWDVRRRGLQGAPRPLVIYQSARTHACIRRAAELLGFGSDALRTIPVDASHRMRVDLLASAVAADRAQGLRPMCVVGSAGTVDIGAVDPLDEIAELCAREGLWLHVDGAYGAPGVADPSKAHLYRGMERAHSLALDPHKWLSVPIECGCLIVRDAAHLRNAFSVSAPYLGQTTSLAPMEYGFQFTRSFRALKVWATLAHLGREGLIAAISRQNTLADALAAHVSRAPELELMAPVTLSIVCFRYRPRDFAGDASALNALNLEVVRTIQREGHAFVTQTTLDEQLVIRASIMHHATNEADLAFLVEHVSELGARLSARASGAASVTP
jgi:aromatic-L-amino-acid decarboxylase